MYIFPVQRVCTSPGTMLVVKLARYNRARQEEMLLYRPRFRHPEGAGKPPNLSEAESMAPSINPLFADAADLAVDVETPRGELLSVDDPRLMNLLPKRTGAVRYCDLSAR